MPSNNAIRDNFGQAYSATLPNLGQAMADTLAFFGCARVYGVGGDFAANIIAALEQTLAVLPASNEMHAGFCACGEAEVSGIGFCLTTYTVGSLPCTSAAALARTEGLPVVFISGAPAETETASGMALHHSVCSSARWDLEHDGALRAFAGLAIRAERLQGARHPGQPNVAGEHFFELVSHAWRQKQPVFIEIPRDLLSQPTQTLKLPSSPDALSNRELRLDGAGLIAGHIADKLRQSKAPLVFVGDRVKLNPRLRDLIEQFCQSLGIPYASNWLAKGVFDESERLCLGAYNGVFSNAQSRHYIEQRADYILELATSILPQDTATAFATGSFHIGDFANKTVLKGTAEREQDLILLLEALLEAPLPRFSVELEARPTTRMGTESCELGFHNLAEVLNQVQADSPRSLIYLPEVGNSFFASFDLQTRANPLGRSWLGNPWYAAMGTALPYARAVAEALKAGHHEQALPVVIIGDGGFHFQQNELIHFLKSDLEAVILLMRNEVFHLGKSSDGPIYHCSDKRFDALKLVEAFGGTGLRCCTTGEFYQVLLEKTQTPSGLTLIEVPTSTAEEQQSEPLRLLNLYIRARNGDPASKLAWDKLSRG